VHCGGTGKVVRHHEIVRRFELREQRQIVGTNVIPEQRFAKSTGDLVYNAEINEPLYADAPPEGVPTEIWRLAVQLSNNASEEQKVSGTRPTSSQGTQTRTGLQVMELVRITYNKVDYRYADQDYTFYTYDVAGEEKFYADRYPARWDRIDRLVRFITTDLMTPVQGASQSSTNGDHVQGYRVPIEKPPYSVSEESDIE
jgi:hypothetical protein